MSGLYGINITGTEVGIDFQVSADFQHFSICADLIRTESYGFSLTLIHADPVWKKYKWNRSIYFKVSADFKHWSICADLIQAKFCGFTFTLIPADLALINLYIFIFIFIFFIPKVIFPADMIFLTYPNFWGFNVKSCGFMNVSLQFRSFTSGFQALTNPQKITNRSIYPSHKHFFPYWMRIQPKYQNSCAIFSSPLFCQLPIAYPTQQWPFRTNFSQEKPYYQVFYVMK